MAAPTNDCNVKKVLANPEPSTHGPKRTSLGAPHMSAFGGKADMTIAEHMEERKRVEDQARAAANR